MSTKTFNNTNSETIDEYERTNNVQGASLVVDYQEVMAAKYSGQSKPTQLSYGEQIAAWEAGFTSNRVEAFGCEPKGWYWVKYKAAFDTGTKITPKCNLADFRG